jgi:hypothetical protein
MKKYKYKRDYHSCMVSVGKNFRIEWQLAFIVEKYCETCKMTFSDFIRKLILSYFARHKGKLGRKLKEQLIASVERQERKSLSFMLKEENSFCYWSINAKRKIIALGIGMIMTGGEINMEIISELINNEIKRFDKLPGSFKQKFFRDKKVLEEWKNPVNFQNVMNEVSQWKRLTFGRLERVEELPWTRKKHGQGLDEE